MAMNKHTHALIWLNNIVIIYANTLVSSYSCNAQTIFNIIYVCPCACVFECGSVGACSMACFWKSEYSSWSRSLFSISVLVLSLCLCSLLASLSFRFLADAPVSTSLTTRGMLAFWLSATVSDSYMGLGDWTSGCQTFTGSVFSHIFNLITYW